MQILCYYVYAINIRCVYRQKRAPESNALELDWSLVEMSIKQCLRALAESQNVVTVGRRVMMSCAVC